MNHRGAVRARDVIHPSDDCSAAQGGLARRPTARIPDDQACGVGSERKPPRVRPHGSVEPAPRFGRGGVVPVASGEHRVDREAWGLPVHDVSHRHAEPPREGICASRQGARLKGRWADGEHGRWLDDGASRPRWLEGKRFRKRGRHGHWSRCAGVRWRHRREPSRCRRRAIPRRSEEGGSRHRGLRRREGSGRWKQRRRVRQRHARSRYPRRRNRRGHLQRWRARGGEIHEGQGERGGGGGPLASSWELTPAAGPSVGAEPAVSAGATGATPAGSNQTAWEETPGAWMFSPPAWKPVSGAVPATGAEPAVSQMPKPV